MRRLENKKVVVTGGTRGIGKAIATSFVKQGASVIIVGTNDERGQQACELLKSYRVSVDQQIESGIVSTMSNEENGDQACAVLQEQQTSNEQQVEFRKVDVASHDDVTAFGKEINEMWGGVDIIVNCAGITRDRLMIKIKEDDWDSVLDTNLKSVYNMTHAFLRGMMKKRGGRIINISSVVGIMGNPGQVNYAASKSGMIGMSKSLAKEVASRKITVNCIAPGFIETDMTDQLTDAQKENVLKQVPMGRLGFTEEIANAALFLASDESAYITGQVLTVDGGMTA